MPESTPWSTAPRGNSDGVSDRQKKVRAPTRPPKQRRRRKTHRNERLIRDGLFRPAGVVSSSSRTAVAPPVMHPPDAALERPTLDRPRATDAECHTHRWVGTFVEPAPFGGAGGH